MSHKPINNFDGHYACTLILSCSYFYITNSSLSTQLQGKLSYIGAKIEVFVNFENIARGERRGRKVGMKEDEVGGGGGGGW